MSERDESRLPRWAQTELTSLRANLIAAQTEIAAMTGEWATAVQIDPYPGEPPRYLCDRAVIRYHVGGRNYIEVTLREGELQVSGDQRLAILPWAANSLKVRVWDP
jgi:hypothetical protein